MYTMHFYAATHKHLRDASDAALAAGIPIFVSECAACEASGDGPMDLEEWKKYRNMYATTQEEYDQMVAAWELLNLDNLENYNVYDLGRPIPEHGTCR